MNQPGRVLFYSMGGGLGHVTRSLVLSREISRSPWNPIILASSSAAGIATGYSHVRLDIVPPAFMKSRDAYCDFFMEYIELNNIRAIITDTFPWGIIGELGRLAPHLPRILIARSLNWKEYLRRIKGPLPWGPLAVLVIEPQEDEYMDFLNKNCRVRYMDEPILLSRSEIKCSDGITCSNKWLVIHTGDKVERDILESLAFDKMASMGMDDGEPDRVYPDRGVFPAQEIIPYYDFIVSGAGYNMAACASQAPPWRKHFLFPFRRRYDDQESRLYRLDSWKGLGFGGAKKAAGWIEECLEGF